MLNKENRIRVEYIEYNSTKQKQYVHKCCNCGQEMLKTKSEERTSTCYCSKCVSSYRNKRLDSQIFNEIGEKFCPYCNRFLNTDKFIKKGKQKTGFSTACSKCHNLKEFGINSLDYENLLTLQNNVCAICKLPETAKDKHKETVRQLAVDHCHESGDVRGLLCTNCNIMLGQAKDNINILQNAIDYLKIKNP